MHGWICICYWSSILYRIFCLRLFIYVSIYYMLLLYLHYSIYSIIHTNLLLYFFGYLFYYLLRVAAAVSYLNHIIVYMLVYQYIYNNKLNHIILYRRSTKKCWISKMFNFTAYMEQRIMADTTIYMHRHDVIYDNW